MAKGLKSQRGLAQRVGVSQPTVAGWLKRDDWPASRTGPWDEAAIERVIAWRRTLQEDRAEQRAADPADGGTRASRERIKQLNEYHKMRLAKVLADEAEGRVVDRELLDRALAGLTAMFIAALEDAQEALPYQLAGEPTAHQPKIREAFDGMRRRLAAHAEIELAGVEDAIKAKRDGRKRGRGRGGAG